MTRVAEGRDATKSQENENKVRSCHVCLHHALVLSWFALPYSLGTPLGPPSLSLPQVYHSHVHQIFETLLREFGNANAGGAGEDGEEGAREMRGSDLLKIGLYCGGGEARRRARRGGE